MKRAALLCMCLLAAMAGNVLAAGSIGIVVNDASPNPFGRYMLEILKTEGFGDLETVPLAGLTLEKLQAHDTIVLAETPLGNAQAKLFRDYVSNGGNLVAMRPDAKLDDLFGIARAIGMTSEGYIKLDSDSLLSAGLEIASSMKTHGDSDHFAPAVGATKVASLRNSSDADAGYAAVIESSSGKGRTAAFSFDLAKNIVLLRQGNSAWAGQEHDGVPGLRSSDLFYDAATKTSWNDASRSAILQADEQIRLLSHIIESMNAAKTPMPRFWYFPDAKKSVLIITGDQDGSTMEDMDAQYEMLKSRGGTSSGYLLEMGNPPPPADMVKRWLSSGQEPAIHFDDTGEMSGPTWAGMNKAYDEGVAQFKSRYPGMPMPKSVRNHALVWCGNEADGRQEFAAQAEIEMNHGLGLDLNNYYFQPFQGASPHSIPTGLPMRFAKSTGKTQDIFCNDTNIPDESFHDQASETFADMLEASLTKGKYCWIVVNFHQVLWAGNRQEVLDVLDASEKAKVPVWSGAKMDSFVRRRDASSFRNVNWDGQTLSFEVDAQGAGDGAITVMTPARFDRRRLAKIIVADAEAKFFVEAVAGADYAFFTIGDGRHFVRAIYASDGKDGANGCSFQQNNHAAKGRPFLVVSNP